VTLALGNRSPGNTLCHEDTSSRATDILIGDTISVDLPLEENTSCHENTSSKATDIRTDDTTSVDLASERKHFMPRRYFKHGNRQHKKH
jgi:hypothetical protein